MSDEAPTGTRSQTDVVIEGIKEMLTRGDLHPGSRLPVEKDLAAQLGVSRGSLREGVRALATLGVLETRQGDGTYVTALDPRTLLVPLGFLADLQQPAHAADLLAVRRVLETESVALAATRLSDDDLNQLDEVLNGVDSILEHDPDMDLEAFIEADAEFHRIIARAAAKGGNVALFAHAHILRILAACWIQMPPVTGSRLALGTGTVSVLGYERETRVISEWNRTLD